MKDASRWYDHLHHWLILLLYPPLVGLIFVSEMRDAVVSSLHERQTTAQWILDAEHRIENNEAMVEDTKRQRNEEDATRHDLAKHLRTLSHQLDEVNARMALSDPQGDAVLQLQRQVRALREARTK